MPEFILDGMHLPEFRALDSFTQGYVQALFFTDEERLCEESEGEREMPGVAINMATMESRFVGGNSPGFADLAPETLARIIADCAAFQTANAAILERAYILGETQGCYDEERAGMDFWYTRNGHGCGYWDRGLGEVGDLLSKACGHGTAFPEIDTGLGDDGKVYF